MHKRSVKRLLKREIVIGKNIWLSRTLVQIKYYGSMEANSDLAFSNQDESSPLSGLCKL